MEFKAERKPLGITGQHEPALVERSEELPNRGSFGTIRRGGEADMDDLVGNDDLARRREDVRDDLLRLAWSPQVRSDQRCEIGLDVRADDPDHVDDRLELTWVTNELARENGLFDGCVGRGLRPEGFEIALEFERVDELLLDRSSA